MSKYGNSYSGNDFLEWWRTHYGTEYDGTSGITKTDTMTDEDYAIGQTLFSNHQKKQKIENDYQTSSSKLLENYSTAKGAFGDNKRQSQQNASIAFDKLKKYLPTQIRAQGLGGLGVSESSMLQAYNNYSNDMNTIESEYAKNMTELEKAYGESSADLEKQKNDLLYYADKDESGNLLVQNVLNEYKALHDRDKITAEEEFLKSLDLYEAGEDWSNGLALLEANKDKFVTEGLYDTKYDVFASGLKQQQEAEEKAEAEAKQAEYDKNVVEGKQYLNVKELVYSSHDGGAHKSKYQPTGKYQITGEASSEDLNSSEFKKGLSELGVSGPSAANIKNGTVIQVTQRSGAEWIDDLYNYTFGLVLPDSNSVSDVSTNFIYYNGKWYKCKQV